MREFINKYGMPVILVIILLASACWWFFGLRVKAPNVSHAFFIDEETGEESVLPLDEYPPRINKSTGKPTLVQEVKYSCDGGKTAKVAYYVKYAEGTKKELEAIFAKTGKPAGVDVSNGTFVRAPEKGAKWLSSGNPESSAFTKISCPEGNDIQIVLPP